MQYQMILCKIFLLYFLFTVSMTYYFSPFTLVNQYQPFLNLNSSNIFTFETFYKIQNLPTVQVLQEKITQPNFELQNQFKQSKNQPTIKKIQKKSNKIEDKNFGFRDQDKQRNILSNILKSFLAALIQKGQMNILVSRSLELINSNMSIEEFYIKAKIIFADVKSYLSPKTLKQKLYSQDESDSCKKVLRIVLSHYLKLQFGISLLRSSRVKRKSKLLQMKKARYLRSLIQ